MACISEKNMMMEQKMTKMESLFDFFDLTMGSSIE